MAQADSKEVAFCDKASADAVTAWVATREFDFNASRFVLSLPNAKKSVTESRVRPERDPQSRGGAPAAWLTPVKNTPACQAGQVQPDV